MSKLFGYTETMVFEALRFVVVEMVWGQGVMLAPKDAFDPRLAIRNGHHISNSCQQKTHQELVWNLAHIMISNGDICSERQQMFATTIANIAWAHSATENWTTRNLTWLQLLPIVRRGKWTIQKRFISKKIIEPITYFTIH